MDPLSGTLTLFGDVIKGKAGARRRNPRLNALLEEVEGILENYSRPENNGPGSKSDDVAERTGVIKTEPGSEPQHSETTADDLDLNLDLEVKQELESQSQLGRGSRANPESELESSVEEPWGSAERKVFGIEWILEFILGYFDDDPVTLFKFRYVNKQWNKVSTEILNARQTTKIRITYGSDGYKIRRCKNTFPLECDSVTHDFDSAHHSGGHFPWNYFSIKRGSLNNPQLQSFLSKHGRIIKQLNIELSQLQAEIPNTLITDLRRLLLKQAPFLEVLTLSEFPREWEELRLFPEPKEELGDVLKNLKEIHFASEPPKRVAKDLLKVSRRLRKIGWDGYSLQTSNPYYWELLLDSNRVKLLARLQLKFPVLATESSLLWKLIERQPMLSYLEIDSSNLDSMEEESFEGHQDAFSIVSKLLESSSSTLTTLVIPQFILRKISPIPRLPKLKRLVLCKAGTTSFPVDGNFSLAEYFPHMTDLAILLDPYPEDLDCWKDFFPDLTKRLLNSVRTLEFYSTVPHYALLVLTYMKLDVHLKFPNVKQLTLNGVRDFALSSKFLWRLVRLQTLEINIDLHQGAENKYPDIDAGFTGFSNETCVQLYESSDDIEISSLNGLRKYNSLLDMKCLETLTIVLTGFGGDELNKPFISHVSGLFAFRMCPKLKVKLQVYVRSEDRNKIKSLLCPIFPYVQRTEFKNPGTMSRFLNIL